MEEKESPLTRRFALAFLTASTAVACTRKASVVESDHVRAKKITGALPKKLPGSELWDTTTEYDTALAPQNVATPMLREVSVPRVKVRALNDGTWVAFRLEWRDASKDELFGPSRFSDACAVQVPRDPGTEPSPMMGQPGSPVRILYWKAAWQTANMLAALHPNKPPTDYPMEAASEAHRERMEQLYAPARNVHNPNFHTSTDAPVFLGEAEMFGSLTAVEEPQSDGRGEYADGKWRVVLAAPIAMLGTAARAGRESKIAFAVWEGGAKNAGGRKMRAELWTKFVIE